MKTFKDLREIDNLIGGLYKVNKNLEKSKFGYAYKRFAEKSFYPMLKEYNQELGFLRIDNALEDPTTKEVLQDPNPRTRGFKYSKEGLKKIIQQEVEFDKKWDAKEIEITPFISAYVPEELTDEDKELLIGVVLE